MNKSDLIADFRAKPWVGAVTSLNAVSDDRDATNMYSFNYFETGSKVAVWKTATIYVQDEGLDTESAYFKDRYPEQTIKEAGAIVEAHKDFISQQGGYIKDVHETYITAERLNKETKVIELWATDIDGPWVQIQ